jgi:hypothetical protein
MEFEPKQIKILMHKMAFNLGNKLEGLLYQTQNILDNHLNNLMIDHNGQAELITGDEIIGAFEIATIHNGHPSYFLSGWDDDNEGEIGS